MTQQPEMALLKRLLVMGKNPIKKLDENLFMLRRLPKASEHLLLGEV